MEHEMNQGIGRPYKCLLSLLRRLLMAMVVVVLVALAVACLLMPLATAAPYNLSPYLLIVSWWVWRLFLLIH